jgi:hypothetical protein
MWTRSHVRHQTIEAEGTYCHESTDPSTPIPSINNHMDEFSPCPPHTPYQNSKEAVEPQQNRNPAPIEHSKGQVTRKEDAISALLADQHAQEPQQNRMLKRPRTARTLEFEDSVNSVILTHYYSNDILTNTPHEAPATTPHTTMIIQSTYHPKDIHTVTSYKEDLGKTSINFNTTQQNIYSKDSQLVHHHTKNFELSSECTNATHQRLVVDTHNQTHPAPGSTHPITGKYPESPPQHTSP